MELYDKTRKVLKQFFFPFKSKKSNIILYSTLIALTASTLATTLPGYPTYVRDYKKFQEGIIKEEPDVNDYTYLGKLAKKYNPSIEKAHDKWCPLHNLEKLFY